MMLRTKPTLQLILIAGLWAVLSSGVAYAQDDLFRDRSLEKESKGRVEVSETTFDFGYTGQGVSISHIYWIKNTGEAAINQLDVKPGCGCTKAPLEKSALAVGESTYVELIFDTGHYRDHVAKTARVVTDIAIRPPTLTFTAHPTQWPQTIAPLRISPFGLNLDAERPEDQAVPGEYAITIQNVSSEPLRVRLVSAPLEPGISITIPEEPIASAQKATITVHVSDLIVDRMFTQSFTLEASDADGTRYTLPISKAMRWGPEPRSSH